jgi:hypothetical protein
MPIKLLLLAVAWPSENVSEGAVGTSQVRGGITGKLQQLNGGYSTCMYRCAVTFRNSAFCPHSVYYDSHNKQNFPIKWLGFIMEALR